MDDKNDVTNKGAVPKTKCKREKAASSSSTFENLTAGAIATEGGTNIIEKVVLNQQISQKPPEELKNFKFQIADPIPTFHGRDGELKFIKEAFGRSSGKQYKLVVLCGYGGIGKTELARKYVKQNRHKFEKVIWINSEFESNMIDDFKCLQKSLKDRGYFCSQLKDVYEHLNDEKCIIIFDNAEDMKSIRPFLPETNNNKSLFLITAQYKNWGSYESIPLQKLDLKSAENIIKSVLNEHDFKITNIQLQNLMKKCESVPLVLQITAGYICGEIIDARDAGVKYDIDDIIDNINTDCEIIETEFQRSSADSYSKSIFEAVFRTLNKILSRNDEVSKRAADIMGISAYLNADGIDDDMLEDLSDCTTRIFEKSLAVLVQYCLIQIRSYYIEKKKISLHRTVQECIRHHYKKINDNKYYSKSLHVLLRQNFFYSYYYSKLYEMIFKYGEEHLDLICSFYEENKCQILCKRICTSATYKILEHLLKNTDLINNPEFLSAAINCKRKDINLMYVLKEFNVAEGSTAVYIACTADFIEDIWQNIQNFVKNGTNINSKNSSGNTVLHNLCESGGRDNPNKDKFVFERCVLVILNGADTGIKNNKKETASEIAKKQGLILTNKLLTSGNKNNIFKLVSEYLQFDFLKYLILFKICDVNEKDSEGNTILHTLCGLEKNGSEIFHVIETAFDCQQINLYLKNNKGETAEDISRIKGHQKISNFLNYRIPFEKNLYNYYGDVLTKFPYTQSGDYIDINYRDENGNILLHVVCDLQENSEQDLLYYVAHLIISKEARINIKNKASETVEDIARRNNRLLLADYFKMKTNNIFDFILVAFKHKNYELAKFIWRRFFSVSTHIDFIVFLDDLFGSEISDENIIYYINDLHFDMQNMIYDKVIEEAQQSGRMELCDLLMAVQLSKES